MKQPKITFLTDRMIRGHGVDLVVDRVADGLSKKGYLCEVYSNLVDETFTNRKSYKIYKLPPVGLANFFILEKRIRKFTDFFNNKDTDLFIIQSFPFYSLIPMLKKPTLVVDHGIVSTTGMPIKRRIFYKYQKTSQNLSYFKKARKVVCVSDYILKQLPDFIRRKSTVIHNGIDHYRDWKLQESDVKDFRESLDVGSNDVLLLYVGRLNLINQPYKGLTELVDIFQQVNLDNPKIKLLAVGYGSKNDEEFLKNQGVLCIRNAPEESMPLLYNACDIYTTCSQWEGFDLPAGEAQYFGKPVICYGIGAHPEILLNGKTGYTVNNREEFGQKIKHLANQKDLRLKMGTDAREFIEKFSWQNSIDRYDSEVRKILNIKPEEKLTIPEEELRKITEEESRRTLELIEKDLYKKVTILIVNYNSSFACLKECIDSLKDQTYKNIEILIFDNNSQNTVLDLISSGYKDIRILKSEKNLGLGEAINQALKAIESKYVLISNFDVTYDKIAIEEFVDMICGLDNKYIGLAPKIKLYYQRDYIESVGVYIDNNFYPGYNGIGQLDLDQYNIPEDVFGVSFTSAFIKKDYLTQSVIGPIEKPIDPTYFLFYEDIDLCYRANMMGYKFKSCPTAVCFHKYAYSFRDETTAFQTKYYYQKLNAVKLAYKNAEMGNMKRIINNELGIQKQNLKDRNFKNVAKKIFSEWRYSKHYLKKQRQYIQMTRQLSDNEIIKFSWGENNFFDIVKNEPVYCIANLILIYKRLFIITGNRKYEEYINYLSALDSTRFRTETELLKKHLHGKLEYEPNPIHNFIERIQ
jgi:GT2 family glycosyltransferase/glycosyltransferase involved in cell wall biosynthesis